MASYTPNYNLYKPAGTDQFDNFLTEFGNNMDIIDSNLGGGGGSSTLGGLSDVNLTSPITNDALIYDGAEWANSPLSAVAFSGDYTDLLNAPTIPTNTSDLNNDSGFLDSSDITVTQVQTTGTKIATIDVDGNSTDLYAPTGGGGSKHTILNESGTALADEPNLQFTDGLKASDDSGNNKTKVGVDTTFTEASTRANIASGDTFSTILGKIKKWFTDIPNLFVDKTGDTMTGDLTIKAALAVKRASTTQATFERDNSGTSSLSSIIYLGNNKAEGTTGCSDGAIGIYGKGSYYTTFDAPNSTANRKLSAPDKSGTIALTSDIPDVSGKADKIGSYIYNATSGASSLGNKYCLVASIVIEGAYVDGVVQFVFSLRGYPQIKTIEILFENANSNDPNVAHFYCSDRQISAYLVKTATGKWNLYVAYTLGEGVAHYQTLDLYSILINDTFSLRAYVVPVGESVTALPSGTSVKASQKMVMGTVSLSRTAGNQSMIANISHPTLNPSNAYILVSVSNSSNIDAPFNLKTYPFGSSYWTVDATRYSGTFASNATIEVTYQLIVP